VKKKGTEVAVKKQNIATVAATIINKRLNSHSAALKNRQENHTEKTLCTGKKNIILKCGGSKGRETGSEGDAEVEREETMGRDTYIDVREERNSLCSSARTRPLLSLSLSEAHTHFLSLTLLSTQEEEENLSSNEINSKH
jgi:hypothetical protein